jgi:hypothetical protein
LTKFDAKHRGSSLTCDRTGKSSLPSVIARHGAFGYQHFTILAGGAFAKARLPGRMKVHARPDDIVAVFVVNHDIGWSGNLGANDRIVEMP